MQSYSQGSLTKEQKRIIKNYLEIVFRVEPHPSNTYESSFDGRMYGKTSRDLWAEWSRLDDANYGEGGRSQEGLWHLSFDVRNEFEEWESSQIEKVKPRGSMAWSTVGQERTKNAREERQKSLRRREALKNKELMF